MKVIALISVGYDNEDNTIREYFVGGSEELYIPTEYLFRIKFTKDTDGNDVLLLISDCCIHEIKEEDYDTILDGWRKVEYIDTKLPDIESIAS